MSFLDEQELTRREFGLTLFSNLRETHLLLRRDSDSSRLIDRACTKKEAWHFSDRLPELIEERLGSPPRSESDAIKLLNSGVKLQSDSKSTEIQVIAEYGIGRALYELKMFHFAEQEFRTIFSPRTQFQPKGLAFAVLECLNVIHRNHPPILEDKTVSQLITALTLPTLSLQDREIAWEALIQALAMNPKNSLGNRSKEFTQAFHGAGLYQDVAQFIITANQQNNKELVRVANDFFERLKKKTHSDEKKDAYQILLQ
jgi:hypothetical protein